MKTRTTEDDKAVDKPKLYHAAFASCPCGWQWSEPAKDAPDAYYGAARAAAERKATFHDISHRVRGY